MDLLLLFLLSSAIFVQGYGKNNDPNDEPFLPIYPVYPYSPKLMKRGVEKETIAQLSPELYAPKVDAKDSYTASFGANHPRDSYYPNYNPYSKVTSPSNYAYYGSLPYSYQSSPYSTYNPYSTLHGTYNPYSSHTVPSPPPSSYPAIPYSPSYPNYYYQSPYYYPDYYNQPLFHPPPLSPPAVDYSGDAYSDVEAGGKSKDRNRQTQDAPQFVDGANYISANPKDLEGQPSTYKTSSYQNQLASGIGNLQIKGIPIPVPKTTYRVISVAGQPVGPDYPLPASYVKAQQLEELMNHGLVKLLQQVPEYSVRESTKEATTTTTTNDGQDASQNDQSKSTRYLTVPSVIAKTGLTYVVNPGVLRKLNVGQATGQIVQTSKTPLKNIKYPPLAPGVYTAIEKPEQDQTESNEYEKYESYERASPDAQDDYDVSSSQADKQQQQQSYDVNSGQSYQNQNYVTPRAYTYQYTSYNPTQTTSQRQSQLYKNNLDSVNFGVKTKDA
ncbi:DNA-directed RNA polymerase II subunit RPB1-like [Frieseomelitta varia]|uniref:DNA-directed RNA polymerase II subunit RPB1-like n=1 Tax=Frieseomelitta varia TaxID=561572 RepID=UPI001CB67B1F|nr:DNA-directed RNA polymerase II subunit RPB1-like [Frieseomelitta varia]